jgi:nucleoside-diphosphate-sugar epimerase
MRLLVTGCTGFIGSHLTRLLLEEGHTVVGLVRNPGKLDADLRGRVEVLRGDLTLFRDPALVLPEVDVVVHLAAVIAGENEAEYAAINFDAVKDVLAALGRQTFKPRRFVFASSLAAAGPNHGAGVHTETDQTEPIDAYGRAKRDAERLMATQPFPTTSFRPPLVLGPGDSATLTLYKMARSRFAFLPSGPPQRLSFVAVADLVRAILAMAEDTSSEHRLYYTTSETPTTNRALLVAMARAFSPERPRAPTIVPVPHFVLYVAMLLMTALSAIFRFRNQLDRKQLAQMTAPSFVCTSARLTADTGFRAETTLERATEDAVAGYRALGQL